MERKKIQQYQKQQNSQEKDGHKNDICESEGKFGNDTDAVDGIVNVSEIGQYRNSEGKDEGGTNTQPLESTAVEEKEKKEKSSNTGCGISRSRFLSAIELSGEGLSVLRRLHEQVRYVRF